jgi:hypothetical protein
VVNATTYELQNVVLGFFNSLDCILESKNDFDDLFNTPEKLNVSCINNPEAQRQGQSLLRIRTGKKSISLSHDI